MENRPFQGALSKIIIVTVFLAYTILAHEAVAKESVTESVIKLDVATPQKISLTSGKSIVIESPSAVKRVSLAAPAFADAIVLSPRQIYLTGKAPGLTNLILWDGD